MYRTILFLAATTFALSTSAQQITVKKIDQVLEETGQDQLNFVCSDDGLVVVNDKTFVTNALKVCFEAESIEFRCPASESVPRSADTDCEQLVSQS